MFRKVALALVLVPLALLIVTFAVANRQVVSLSFDPFDPVHPALAVELRMFVLILALTIVGVVVGGVAAWLNQHKWRRAARHAEREARELRAELDALKRRSGPSGSPAALASAERPRLSIPPPAA
jgi:Mn2+/Fe2+ NRAMP family transporter